jgi:hypothetical protein
LRRVALGIAGAAVLACVVSRGAWAQPPSQPAAQQLEQVVVRFYATETGGTAQPRFIDERTLAFEARLEAMAEKSDGIGDGYAERHVRAALERHIAETMLASLGDQMLKDLPAQQRPSPEAVGSATHAFSDAAVERLGGRPRIDRAADAEQLAAAEVDVLLARGAIAAWYLDREVAPILRPTDEQLREVFRTSAHPFRGEPYERVRDALARWFVVERERVAETAYLQQARSRVHIVVTK